MVITSSEFLETTLIPTLIEMGMHSPAAEKLLLMTACHESEGFRYRRQIRGPALSYFQIEPATLADLYASYLDYRSAKRATLDKHLPDGMTPLYALEHDDAYAVACARMIYARVSAPLPDVDDEDGLAVYWKQHYNTLLGRGTEEKYLDDWNRYKLKDY